MKKIIFLFLCCVVSLVVKPVFASCTLSAVTSTTPMPLQIGNISAGSDVPIGTQLYYQTYNLNISTSQQDAVNCTTAGQININYYFSSTPLPLNSWSQGMEAGKVYETGVPGIGVWVHQGTNSDIAIPGVKIPGSGSSCSSPNNCLIDIRHKRWDVALIKTGPISPGVISGANLPCVGISYNNTGVDSDGQIENVCLTGSINVVVSTCTTPDVNVPMGNHPVTAFSGVGSTSSWVDASIILTNCPVLYGYGSSGSWYADNSGTNSSGTPIKNIINLKLTPNTDIIDNANGIFALIPDASNAGGIGVQLAYGTGASPALVNFSNTMDYVQPLNTSGNVTIPLVARYIQTSPVISAGLANSAATFLINYK